MVKCRCGITNPYDNINNNKYHLLFLAYIIGHSQRIFVRCESYSRFRFWALHFRPDCCIDSTRGIVVSIVHRGLPRSTISYK